MATIGWNCDAATAEIVKEVLLSALKDGGSLFLLNKLKIAWKEPVHYSNCFGKIRYVAKRVLVATGW